MGAEEERTAPPYGENADRCVLDARPITGVGSQCASDVDRRAETGVLDRNDETASCQLRNCGMAFAECADLPLESSIGTTSGAVSCCSASTASERPFRQISTTTTAAATPIDNVVQYR